jgi:hypothetical protein
VRSTQLQPGEDPREQFGFGKFGDSQWSLRHATTLPRRTDIVSCLRFLSANMRRLRSGHYPLRLRDRVNPCPAAPPPH